MVTETIQIELPAELLEVARRCAAGRDVRDVLVDWITESAASESLRASLSGQVFPVLTLYGNEAAAAALEEALRILPQTRTEA